MANGQVVINSGTQTNIASDLVGTVYYQTIKLDFGTAGVSNPFTGTIPQISNLAGGTITSDTIVGGTLNAGTFTVSGGTVTQINTIGTLPNIPGGSIVITSLPNIPGGTFNLGTVTLTALPNVPNGTLNLIGTVNTIGTFPNLPGGTVNLVTTVTNLSNGTIQNSGTVTGVGSISSLGSLGMLTAGTISMLNAGTITTLPNIPGGTINILAGGTLGILTNGTISSSGTTTGVGSVSNIGSLAVLNAGTINSGTFQINQIPTSKVTNFGTVGTAGAGTSFGTIQGTVGGGTEILLSDWSIVVLAGTPTVSLGWGTSSLPFQGTGLIDGGAFSPGGGIAKSVENSNHSGTNGIIVYGITAGTALFKVAYQVIATTV